MIDSHCHLDHEPLFENLDAVIQRAKDVGIKKILTISTTLKSFEVIKNLVKKDPIIFGTYGIHPHETEKNIVNKEMIIYSINDNKKIIGIGETGLDFFYNHSNKKRQIDSFKEHIEASIELKKPIIIHSRNAEHETYDTLKLYDKKKNENFNALFYWLFRVFKKTIIIRCFFFCKWNHNF